MPTVGVFSRTTHYKQYITTENIFQKVNLAKNKLQVNLSVEEIKPFPYLATFFSEDKESVNRRACFNFIQVVQSMNYGKKIRTIMRQPVENCARFA